MVHLEYFTAPLSERQRGDEVIANPRAIKGAIC
jgi:hypothetical protein